MFRCCKANSDDIKATVKLWLLYMCDSAVSRSRHSLPTKKADLAAESSDSTSEWLGVYELLQTVLYEFLFYSYISVVCWTFYCYVLLQNLELSYPVHTRSPDAAGMTDSLGQISILDFYFRDQLTIRPWNDPFIVIPNHILLRILKVRYWLPNSVS